MPGRTHSREFKREIVNQVESGQKTTAQLSREHHLSPSLIHRWRKEVVECPPETGRSSLDTQAHSQP